MFAESDDEENPDEDDDGEDVDREEEEDDDGDQRMGSSGIKGEGLDGQVRLQSSSFLNQLKVGILLQDFCSLS